MMKIQRKLLTEEQKKAICKSVTGRCSICPVMKEFDDARMCIEDVKAMEDFIKDYWNEEVEVDL